MATMRKPGFNSSLMISCFVLLIWTTVGSANRVHKESQVNRAAARELVDYGSGSAGSQGYGGVVISGGCGINYCGCGGIPGGQGGYGCGSGGSGGGQVGCPIYVPVPVVSGCGCPQQPIGCGVTTPVPGYPGCGQAKPDKGKGMKKMAVAMAPEPMAVD